MTLYTSCCPFDTLIYLWDLCICMYDAYDIHNDLIWNILWQVERFKDTRLQTNICTFLLQASGPGSSVGIATDYGLADTGIESRWGRDFPTVQTGHGAHPASCKMGTGSFLGVKCGRGVLMTTHPLLVPRSWKSRAIPLPILWATPGL